MMVIVLRSEDVCVREREKESRERGGEEGGEREKKRVDVKCVADPAFKIQLL